MSGLTYFPPRSLLRARRGPACSNQQNVKPQHGMPATPCPTLYKAVPNVLQAAHLASAPRRISVKKSRRGRYEAPAGGGWTKGCSHRSWPEQQRKFHELQQPEGAAEEALGHEKPASRLLAWLIDKDGGVEPGTVSSVSNGCSLRSWPEHDDSGRE